ncbi:MAG TPA: GNVR domain-containing protein [Candidatus Binataceae bacterium]|nr:GNVR domain-containing protein [Candidatus Binataceae bacterium]
MNHRDLTYWTEMIFRRRVTVIEVAAVVFGLVVIGTIMWPPVYQGTAKIFVRDNRAELLVSPGMGPNSQQNPAVVSNPVSEEDLNSEMELLTSTYIIKRAIEPLQPPAHEKGIAAPVVNGVNYLLSLPGAGYRAMHAAPNLDSHEAWALDLGQHLSASIIKKSDIIEVNFRSHDPAWSKQFLDLLLSAYLDYHAHISHDPAAEQFFSRQAKLLQGKLDDAENHLRDFQIQSGITSVDDQRSGLVERLDQLQLAYDKNQSDLAFSEQQAASFKDLLDGTPARLSKETRQVQNMALAQLKPQVMQLRAERAELLTRYQPDSERIRQIDAKLAAAQKILDTEDHLEVSEKSTDINPLWVTENTNLNQAKAQVAALKASQDSIGAQVTETRKQLTDMASNVVILDRLQREVQNAKDAYLSYTRKSEEARAAEALNRSRILNVSVAQPATAPLRPVFPNVPINTAAGLILGLALGLVAAYRQEENDPKIYSSATIAELAGLEVVAVLNDEF